MPLRFRKSIKLFPGVRINLSKSGISTSLGVLGATVNVKTGRKTKATVGLPGSGLSYTAPIEDKDSEATVGNFNVMKWNIVAAVAFILFKLLG